jgi:hypothetical protein
MRHVNFLIPNPKGGVYFHQQSVKFARQSHKTLNANTVENIYSVAAFYTNVGVKVR